MLPAAAHSPITEIPTSRSGSAQAGPRDIAAVRDRIDAALTGFLTTHAQYLAELGPQAQTLTGAVARFLRSGGKRLRPLLCYWGWRGAGGVDGPAIITAAASLELLHTFALIHDDIMDASDTRRGQPTVHRAFATAHTHAHWQGDSYLFGVGAGILAGDLSLIFSDAMFHQCGLAPQVLHTAQALLATMRAELATGQYLELVEQARRGYSTTTAAQVIRYKTAKYTVERPLQIGGLLAGATPDLLAAYTEFGIPLGEAFQLRDDLLDAFGEEVVTGKSTMGDFREGKPTWLIALAWRHATTTQRQRITALHGNPDLDTAGAQELREIITATGARAEIEHLITTRTTQAQQALQDAPVAPQARAGLRELLHAATTRTT